MAKVDLWLKGVREGQKILAIKALREHLDLGLRAAKDRVEAAPSLLAKGMELSEAERLSAILTEAGVVTNLAVKERAVCVDPRDPARGDQTIVRLWRTPIRVFEETGKFGANGTVEERGFDSEDEAQRELARRIEKQRAAGRLVFAGDTEALAALSAQHAQLAPLAGSDQEAAAVHADWMLEQGDPRGELAAVQLALESTPEDAPLQAREAQLLAGSRAHLLGELGRLGENLALTWKRGELESVRILSRELRGSGDARLAMPWPELLGLLARLPAARHLRRLLVDEGSAGFLDALAHLELPSLRELRLGLQDGEMREYDALGPVDVLWRATPALELLSIAGRWQFWGEPREIGLRRLEVRLTARDERMPKTVSEIFAERWPLLETLRLRIERDCPLLEVEASTLPALRSLTLEGSGDLDFLLSAFREARALESLTLVHDTVDARIARRLIGHPVLAGLKTLDLRGITCERRLLPREVRRELEAAFPNALLPRLLV